MHPGWRLVKSVPRLTIMTSYENDAGAVTPELFVGRRVREIRQTRGLSVEDLAVACEQAGAPYLSAPALYRLERGERQIHLNVVYSLACVLGVSPLVLQIPADADQSVRLTQTRTAPAVSVYEWTAGMRPAPTTGEVSDKTRAGAWFRLRMYLPFASRRSGTLRVEIDEDNIAEFLRDNGKGDD